MSGRVDCRLETLDTFLFGAAHGDGDFLEHAELVRGLSGRVELEEKEEEALCFLVKEILIKTMLENCDVQFSTLMVLSH